jgi:hypothetical protein
LITDIQKALFEGAFFFAPGGTEEVCGAQACQGVTQNGDGRGTARMVVRGARYIAMLSIGP